MLQGISIYSSKNIFGQLGHIHLSSSDVSTEFGTVFHCINAISTSIVSYTDINTGTRFSTKSIPAAGSIYGLFKDIQLTSGDALAYIANINEIVNSSSVNEMNQVDIWLVGGQSNADGRVLLSNGSTPLYFTEPQLEFYMFNGTNGKLYSYANIGLDGNGSSFTNETSSLNKWSFVDVAIYKIAQTTQKNIIVCRVTEGGTSISISESSSRGCWNVDYASIPGGTTKLLQELNSRYDNLIAYLNALGVSHETKGMIWHQGEQDTGDAANYETNFANVIEEVRSFTENTALPIYYGTISELSAAYNATINAAQLSLASEDVNLYCRDNSALTLADTVHFDAAASITFGEWIANQVNG